MDPAREIDEVVRVGLHRDPSLTLVDALVYCTIARFDPTLYVQLANMSGLNERTARKSIRRLESAGWLRVEYASPRTRDSRVRFVLSAPHQVQAAMAKIIRRRRSTAPRVGEYLMFVWLDLLVVSLAYQNNARPRFLANPPTGYAMEVDRLYFDEKVAFEFQGRQHFEETDLHQSRDKFLAQQTRDLTKQALCERAGVALVEITEEDLTYQGMVRKAGSHLRLRRIDRDGEVVRILTQLCGEYVAAGTRALRAR